MSLKNISIALEKHLNALGTFPTASEGVTFEPVTGTAWQRITVLPAQPFNASQGAKHYIELGYMQVMLFYPDNQGKGDALTRAELIRNHFKRGTTLTENTINVIITQTPTIGGAIVDDGWLSIPISIYYQADIFI